MSQQETQPTDKASSAAVVTAAVSVLYAWYVFYLRGDRRQGVFIGLWPPTILAFATYLDQTDMMEKMRDTSHD